MMCLQSPNYRVLQPRFDIFTTVPSDPTYILLENISVIDWPSFLGSMRSGGPRVPRHYDVIYTCFCFVGGLGSQASVPCCRRHPDSTEARRPEARVRPPSNLKPALLPESRIPANPPPQARARWWVGLGFASCCWHKTHGMGGSNGDEVRLFTFLSNPVPSICLE